MQPKTFSKDNPCTKVDLYNCFRNGAGYPTITLVEAQSKIGQHAPKYLLGKSYIRQYPEGNVDVYELTTEGIAWLEKGIKRHLELHPEDAKLVTQPLPGQTKPPTSGKPRVVRRRT